MLLDRRGTVASLPANEVASGVSEEDMALKISCFLATLIMYDAGEYTICVGQYTNLTFHPKVITLDKEVTR